MPLFVMHCIDKPDSLEVRMGAREAHLAYVREKGQIRLGGPYLDDAGQMCGSLMILEAEDLDAAHAYAADDPYNKAGLFQSVEFRPFRVTVGQL
jgi:uncharacterized protein YciI